MTPQHLTGLIAQRAARAISIGALAFGLAVTLLAPMAAEAAPLTPGKTPSYAADLVSEMYLFVYENGSVRAAATLRNRGSSPAAPARLKLTLPRLHRVSSMVPPPGARCTQSGLGTVEIVCSVDAPLAGGDAVTFEVFGTPGTTGILQYAVTVDPNNEVREASEANNFAVYETVVLWVR